MNHRILFDDNISFIFLLIGIFILSALLITKEHPQISRKTVDLLPEERGEDLQIRRPSNVLPKSPSVEILQSEEGFRIYKNGKPLYVKGVAGRAYLEEVVNAGGNTIRTWNTFGIDTLLDKAGELGLSVLVGIEIGRERLGFDYNDSLSVTEQRVRVRTIVQSYKDHPAILAWLIGNEPDLYYTNKKLWEEVNQLSQIIHEEDPNHLTSVVCLPGRDAIEHVIQSCPDIDFITCNVFEKLPEFSEEFRAGLNGGTKPYIIGEWASEGYWEVSTTEWNAPIEPNSIDKFQLARSHYETGIEGDPYLCMGSCIFFWGEKIERTPTWFSLFLEGGKKTVLVDLMYYMWSKKAPDNHAPFIYRLFIEGKDHEQRIYLESGETYKAIVEALDEEGDFLTYQWELMPEGNYQNTFGGDREVMPKPIFGLFERENGSELIFEAPKPPGAYRLYIYIRDGCNNIAAGNIPMYVQDHSLF